MFRLLRLFDNHEINAWRDEQTLLAASVLNQLAADLIASSEEELANVSWKDGLLSQQSFLAKRVRPNIRAVAGPVVEKLIAAANAELVKLAQFNAIWHDRPERPFDEQGLDGWQDIAVAAGPLAGGVAVAASLPAIAITTSTAFFGLVTTTAVSWPVVVGGGTVAGLAVATGLFNAGRIRDKAEARLRRKVHRDIVATLLEGTAKHPSILDQLGEIYSDTAKRAKEL